MYHKFLQKLASTSREEYHKYQSSPIAHIINFKDYSMLNTHSNDFIYYMGTFMVHIGGEIPFGVV